MLAKVSKRISDILQTQQPQGKIQQKKNDSVNRSRISTMQPADKFNSSLRKDKPISRSNSKSLMPPKSAQDIIYNSPSIKNERQLSSSSKKNLDKSNYGSNMNIEMFLSLYKDEIIALIRPLLIDFEQRIAHRLDKLENQVKTLAHFQQIHSSDLFNTKFKQPLMTKEDNHSQIENIIQKAHLIVGKIDENQTKVIIKFKQIQQQIRLVRTKALEKCSCYNHLQTILETQNYLCQQIKDLKQQQGIIS